MDQLTSFHCGLEQLDRFFEVFIEFLEHFKSGKNKKYLAFQLLANFHDSETIFAVRFCETD